jgi:ABC-2 type transport system ATP-binding protein
LTEPYLNHQNAQPDIPLIECTNLTRDYGKFRAVDSLSLSVRAGEIFGFLGPNGAGKTTTIRMITGLIRPTSGFAKVGPYDIRESPIEAKRLFGYIPDNPYLYDKLTGGEYLRFMSDIYNVPEEGLREKMDSLLNLFELKDKEHDLIQGYSRGMRQKIALAGALIHNPSIIILDEPTVGLDPRSARILRDVLRHFADHGGTVFFSTHILEIAEHLCDRFAIINHGRILTCGALEDLLNLNPGEDKTLEDVFLRLTSENNPNELL